MSGKFIILYLHTVFLGMHVTLLLAIVQFYCFNYYVFNLQKLFVLLLHFPPTMFYEPCYPALFLYGWDHYYLDTISQSPGVGVTDQTESTSLVDIR